MEDAVNPLLPAGYDVAWSVVMVAVVALWAVALVSLFRSAKRMTPGIGLVWALVVLLIPVLGSVAWLAVGRRTLTAHRPETGTAP